MNNFFQQKDFQGNIQITDCSEGLTLSPFSVGNLEDEELIQDILETLETIENSPSDSCEVTVTVTEGPDPPLQITNTDESQGLSSGLSFVIHGHLNTDNVNIYIRIYYIS